MVVVMAVIVAAVVGVVVVIILLLVMLFVRSILSTAKAHSPHHLDQFILFLLILSLFVLTMMPNGRGQKV